MAKTSFYSGSGTNSTDVAAIDSLKTAAEAAKTAAETAQAAAETAEANAETSATNAASSATSVSTSASTATTKASEAAASASTATTKASEASTSASTATTKASEAAASASSASTSASTATTKASEASTSATNAATSETNAASSATSASTSASTATTKASEASTSASTATTKASEAATSATSASTSASTATTKASEAATSASTATTKASEASASATAAASSATSASSAQTAAESARDSALASFDSFDDRYLGAKSSEPSVDNDGNALVGGSLFFDTTASSMKVYTGSAWVSAYTSLSGALLVANNLSDVNNAATSATNLGLGTGNTPTFNGMTTTGDISFGDNVKAKFGNSDLQIYHNGSASFIDDAGNGYLNIQGNGVSINKYTGETMALFVADGAATLYHDNSSKLATSSSGISVSGGATLDSDSTLLDFSRVGDAVAGKLKYVDADTAFHFGTTTNHDWYGISNDTKRFKVDNAGLVSFYNGMDVSGTVTADGFTLDGYGTFDNSGTNLVIQGTHSGGVVQLKNHDSTEDIELGQDYFRIKQGGSERLRLTSSGSLGVGTTNPLNKFVVAEGTNQHGVEISAGTTSYIQAYDRATSDYGDLRIDAQTIAFATDNGTERMRLTANGNVGIGTSSPARELVVSGSSQASIALQTTASGSTLTDGFQVQADGSHAYLWNYENTNILLGTNNTERMRIDSSGNLLVGDTSATFNDTAKTVIRPSSDNWTIKPAVAHTFNRTGSDGAVIEFYRTSSTKVGSIGTQYSTIYVVGDGKGILLNSNGIVPTNGSGTASDNAMDIGQSGNRYDDIYATNGSIQTSDRNEKQDIEELTDAEKRVAVAAKGLLRKFRWKSAVAEKGDEARTHFGIIAQDLQAAFAAEGLDAGDYAMFISSTWTDEETGEERTRMGVRYSELLAFIITSI